MVRTTHWGSIGAIGSAKATFFIQVKMSVALGDWRLWSSLEKLGLCKQTWLMVLLSHHQRQQSHSPQCGEELPHLCAICHYFWSITTTNWPNLPQGNEGQQVFACKILLRQLSLLMVKWPKMTKFCHQLAWRLMTTICMYSKVSDNHLQNNNPVTNGLFLLFSYN